MHRCIGLWLVSLLVGAAAVWAQDAAKDKGKDDQSSPDVQFNAIATEYKASERELAEALRAAKTDADKKKVEDQRREKHEAFAIRFLALAQKHPKTGTAFNALVFVVANTPAGSNADKATDLLLQDHLAQVVDLFDDLAQGDSPAVEKLLRSAMSKGSDKRIHGRATLALAQFLKNKSENAAKGDAKAAKEAEDLLTQMAEKYADQKDLVQLAKDELFVIRHLSIGKVAPDISGEDSDGKKFKLSDYRGKVVVLDFWAGW
jgi:hypothetical protein